MKRKEKFRRKYRQFASSVLSSIGRCGAAGRSHDPARIAAAQAEHVKLMAFGKAETRDIADQLQLRDIGLVGGLTAERCGNVTLNLTGKARQLP
jgi:hypothetical protein